MDGLNVPETPVASTDTPASISPEVAAPSASVPEAQAQPTVASVPETSTEPSVNEFPDDQAFQALEGPERQSNWQRARTRIGELNQQATTWKPIQEKLDSWGGLEQVEQHLQIAQSLFTPVLDEAGEHLVDPQTGLPAYSAEPFVDQMMESSPEILNEIIQRSLDQALPDGSGQTFGHFIFQTYFGLDPNLVDTFRQIKSPQDAARYLSESGQVTPDELKVIPENYQAAYKSLTPQLRDEVQLMQPAAREAYLAERQELLESRSFREQQELRERQEADRATAHRETQIRQVGERLITDARDRALTTQREKLNAEAAFFGENSADNQFIHDSILREALAVTEADATLKADSDKCNNLFRLSAQLEARGDRYRALQAKVEATRLADHLTRKFANNVTARTEWWSQKLGFAKKGMEAARQTAQGRVEVTQGENPAGNPQPTTATRGTTQGYGYGMTPAEINEAAAELAMRKAGQR